MMMIGITSPNPEFDVNLENPIELTETNLNQLNLNHNLNISNLENIPLLVPMPSGTLTSNTHGNYVNNWNENNEKIIDRWLNVLNQNSYIYDKVSEIYMKKHSQIQICLLIFNSLLAVISYLQFNSNKNFEILVYKYLMMIISSFVALVVNLQRIKKYETKANNYSSTSLELSNLTLSILSQIEIPYYMRKDFIFYLPEIRQKYYALLSKLPNMNDKDYSNAYNSYINFKDQTCKQNFRHQFASDKDENLKLQIAPNKHHLKIDMEEFPQPHRIIV